MVPPHACCAVVRCMICRLKCKCLLLLLQLVAVASVLFAPQVTLQHPRKGMLSPPDSIAILQMLAKLTSAKNIIEVGVFTGYTTLGMALTLPPDGRLIACDVSTEYPSVGE